MTMRIVRKILTSLFFLDNITSALSDRVTVGADCITDSQCRTNHCVRICDSPEKKCIENTVFYDRHGFERPSCIKREALKLDVPHSTPNSRLLGDTCHNQYNCLSNHCVRQCDSLVWRCVEPRIFYQRNNIPQPECVEAAKLPQIVKLKVPTASLGLGDTCFDDLNCVSGNCVPMCENIKVSRCIEPRWSFTAYNVEPPLCIDHGTSMEFFKLKKNEEMIAVIRNGEETNDHESIQSLSQQKLDNSPETQAITFPDTQEYFEHEPIEKEETVELNKGIVMISERGEDVSEFEESYESRIQVENNQIEPLNGNENENHPDEITENYANSQSIVDSISIEDIPARLFDIPMLQEQENTKQEQSFQASEQAVIGEVVDENENKPEPVQMLESVQQPEVVDKQTVSVTDAVEQEVGLTENSKDEKHYEVSLIRNFLRSRQTV